jgi:hypothetical protein
VEHSIHIIAEELLPDNTLELQIVEIEGDVLFMYTTKNPHIQPVAIRSG